MNKNEHNKCEQTHWPKDLKKTKQRLEIYETLQRANKPITVHELYAMLENSGKPMWFSTIYRVLDTLLEHGIVQKTSLHESSVAVYELGDAHKHYAVCVSCNQIIEIHNCPIENFLPELEDKNFHILGHKLQISGQCSNCFGIKPS